MVKPPTRARIFWDPAFRIIPTRFPAVNIWQGTEPFLWDRLDQIEAKTNPRVQAGHDEGYINWSFDSPHPGRFSTTILGAFYAARDERGAVAETVHYQTVRCQQDQLDPHDFDMRVLSVAVAGNFHDLRGKRAAAFPGVMDPDSYAISQRLAEDLHALGSKGIVYNSVREEAHTPCVAAFDPVTVLRAGHLRYLTYRWDGLKVEPIYEKVPV